MHVYETKIVVLFLKLILKKGIQTKKKKSGYIFSVKIRFT